MDVQTDPGTNGDMNHVTGKGGTDMDIATKSTARLPVPISVPDDGPGIAAQNGEDSVPPQQKQTSYEVLRDKDVVHTHMSTGTQIEASNTSSKSKLSTATTIPTLQGSVLGAKDDTSSTTLEMHIRAALRASAGNDRQKFLPMDEIDQTITWDRVFEEVTRSLQHEKSQDDLQKLTHDILDEVKVTDSLLTNRRKIFATLVCINKTAYITYFIDERLYDCHLPFQFSEITQKESHVYWKMSTDKDVEIQCFSRMGWSISDYEKFQEYQWFFQAPYFEIMSDGKRKRPLHYRLDDRHVLPFIEDSEEEGINGQHMMSGGYSDVWRVRIHPAHHSHPLLESPLFAVKRLRPNTCDEEMFKREVATLKRLSGQNHAHLITLQMTYFYRNRYHLLFRWANGNLRDYWESNPEPSDIPRTRNYAIWVASQWLGLARGLIAIHHCPPDDGIDIDDDGSHDGLEWQRINGRHGDIKPENILFFHSPGPQNKEDSASAPRLVISDFGLTEFHRNETNLVNPLNVAMSPTYRPPEYDFPSANISQSYDVWTLGCVLLEFVIWYLQGFDAFDQFSQDRASEDTARPIQEDKYFTIEYNLRTENGKISKAAVLKNSVTTQIESLRQDPRITDFIVDALNFIEQHMLLMQPELRASCGEVVENLEAIFAKTLEDENYCISPVPGKPKHQATNLPMLPPSRYLALWPDGMQLSSEEVSQNIIDVSKASPMSGQRGTGNNRQPPRADDVDRTYLIGQAVTFDQEPAERQRRPWLHWLLCGRSGCFEQPQNHGT